VQMYKNSTTDLSNHCNYLTHFRAPGEKDAISSIENAYTVLISLSTPRASNDRFIDAVMSLQGNAGLCYTTTLLWSFRDHRSDTVIFL